MILIVTNRQDQTADYLILELKHRGVDYHRFNTEDYPTLLRIKWELNNQGVDGYIQFPKRKLLFDEIKSVWYRRPVSPVPDSRLQDEEDRLFVIDESRAALEGIWRTLNCSWVSHPDTLRAAEDKLNQLIVARQTGFMVYPTLVTNEPAEADLFYQKHFGDVIYKPQRHGRLTREDTTKLIFTNRLMPEHIEHLQQIHLSPSLFQKYVHKLVELRVTVIGNKVFAVEIHSQEHKETKDDWRKVTSDRLTHVPYNLPSEIDAKCRQLVKKLGLQFGAIDLVLTPDREYVFLEINPNGQWAWIQQICPEIPLRESLADLLISGIER